MTEQQKIKAFKQELKALLEKHNACINVGYGDGTDTYGICDEHLELEIAGLQPVRLAETWYLHHTDIKETK